MWAALPLGLYVFDRVVVRILLRGRTPIALARVYFWGKPGKPDVITLQFDNAVDDKGLKPVVYMEGHYLYLQCPHIEGRNRLLPQWHPFTISSAPSDGKVTCHIKMAPSGDESFTGKLLNLAKEDKLTESFLFLPSLEGPVSDYTKGVGWLFGDEDGAGRDADVDDKREKGGKKGVRFEDETGGGGRNSELMPPPSVEGGAGGGRRSSGESGPDDKSGVKRRRAGETPVPMSTGNDSRGGSERLGVSGIGLSGMELNSCDRPALSTVDRAYLRKRKLDLDDAFEAASQDIEDPEDPMT